MRHPKLKEPCQHSTSKWRGLCFGVFFSFFINFFFFFWCFPNVWFHLPTFIYCVSCWRWLLGTYTCLYFWSAEVWQIRILILLRQHIFWHQTTCLLHFSCIKGCPLLMPCKWKRKVFFYLGWQRNHLEKRYRLKWPQVICERAGQHLKVPSAPSIHVFWSNTCVWL